MAGTFGRHAQRQSLGFIWLKKGLGLRWFEGLPEEVYCDACSISSHQASLTSPVTVSVCSLVVCCVQTRPEWSHHMTRLSTSSCGTAYSPACRPTQRHKRHLHGRRVTRLNESCEGIACRWHWANKNSGAQDCQGADATQEFRGRLGAAVLSSCMVPFRGASLLNCLDPTPQSRSKLTNMSANHSVWVPC